MGVVTQRWERKAGCVKNCVSEVCITGAMKDERLHNEGPGDSQRGGCYTWPGGIWAEEKSKGVSELRSHLSLASCSTTSFPPRGCSAFSNSFSTLTTPPSSSDVWEETSSCVVSSSSPSLSPGTHKLVTCSDFCTNTP